MNRFWLPTNMANQLVVHINTNPELLKTWLELRLRQWNFSFRKENSVTYINGQPPPIKSVSFGFIIGVTLFKSVINDAIDNETIESIDYFPIIQVEQLAPERIKATCFFSEEINGFQLIRDPLFGLLEELGVDYPEVQQRLNDFFITSNQKPPFLGGQSTTEDVTTRDNTIIVQNSTIHGNVVGGSGNSMNTINTGGGDYVAGNKIGGDQFNAKEIHFHGAKGPDPDPAVNLPPIPVGLHSEMLNYLSKSDINTICFYLDVDYNRLAGETLDDKVAALITDCRRKNRVAELLQACAQRNPSRRWG